MRCSVSRSPAEVRICVALSVRMESSRLRRTSSALRRAASVSLRSAYATTSTGTKAMAKPTRPKLRYASTSAATIGVTTRSTRASAMRIRRTSMASPRPSR